MTRKLHNHHAQRISNKRPVHQGCQVTKRESSLGPAAAGAKAAALAGMSSWEYGMPKDSKRYQRSLILVFNPIQSYSILFTCPVMSNIDAKTR